MIVLLPVLTLALAQLAPPDAAPVARLTLAQALERARGVSPRLGQLRALEVAAEAGLRGARADRWPILGVSAAYSRNSNVPEFVVPQPSGPLVVFPNLQNQGRARADLGLPLYTGGRTTGAVTTADEQHKASEEELTAGRNDLTLEVTAAYWGLAAQRESERVLREAIASYEAHLKDATNFYDSGMTARNDVLSVQVERDRAELHRLEASNAAAVGNANLLRLLDLPPGTRVLPVDEGPATAEGVALEAMVKQALDARPDIRALRHRLSATEASVQVARSATHPQASLLANYEYASPNQKIFPLSSEWRDTWTVGVGVSITAFDGGRTSAATARARAQAEAVSRQLADLEQRVRFEVTSRALDLETASASVTVAARSVEAARENVRVSQDRYQAGVNPSSDLLDAETRLLRAGLEETLARTQLRLARATLERALGR